MIRLVTSELKYVSLLASKEAHALVCSQDETSEQFIGEWAEKRGIRDQLVIATKVSSGIVRTIANPLTFISLVFHELQTHRP